MPDDQKSPLGGNAAAAPSAVGAQPGPTNAELLVAAAARGEICDLSAAQERTISAEIVYALAVGTNPEWPVHTKGIQLNGATILGSLDFASAIIRTPLALTGCTFEYPLILTNALAESINLSASRVPGLQAVDLETRRELALANGFAGNGEATLIDATIGVLDCQGGSFTNPGEYALSADRIDVSGAVFLRSGFSAQGEVGLLGAKIGGDLTCDSHIVAGWSLVALFAAALSGLIRKD